MAKSDEEKMRAKQIGARLAQARTEAGGMTQEEAAHLIGLNPRSVQAHEAGEVIPYRYMRDYERIYSRPVAWFLHGDAAVLGRDTEHREIVERLERLQKAVDAIGAKLT